MTDQRLVDQRMVDQRKEQRRPAEGVIRVWFANPEPFEIQGQLLDVSASGFRMAHECSTLQAGQMVEFAREKAAGRARVIWNRIANAHVETGFLLVTP
jgi:hypothetical protein